MYQVLRRLGVLRSHLSVGTKGCSTSTSQHIESKGCSSSTSHSERCPVVAINPAVGMVDETVRIQVSGLEAKQPVTIVASLTENGTKFESRCVYQADENGKADNFLTSSTAGTFTGVEPMGLFWSLAATPPSRLVKKDVGSPMTINVQVYSGSHAETSVTDRPVTETQIQRYFKKPGVRRIPLEGRFKGTVFVPEGKGPFPALMDMYGGLVSLIETRAALLASHGYVTMALSYIQGLGTPQLSGISYIKDAYKWLMQQDYVDGNRLGAIGLCYGGTLSLQLATAIPQEFPQSLPMGGRKMKVDELAHPAPDFGNLDDLGFGDLDPENKFVNSTRIRVGRSHANYGFPPTSSAEDRIEMERMTVDALRSLRGELAGSYHPLQGMTPEVQKQMTEDHFLFRDDDPVLGDAHGYDDWPTGRGIFFSNNKKFLVWVNEEDHLRIISMQQGGNLAEVWKRLVKGLTTLEKKLTFAHHPKFGYLTFCPTNLGTTLRASVHIRIPNLSQHEKFKSICEQLNLQPRGIHGEHSDSVGGVFDISNKRRMGLTEIQAIQEMRMGVEKIISLEQKLINQKSKGA